MTVKGASNHRVDPKERVSNHHKVIKKYFVLWLILGDFIDEMFDCKICKGTAS